MRVVLDTNVFISGLMLPQSIPGRIMAAWQSGEFDLVLSEPMLEEIARVLAYPKISRRTGWNQARIDQYVSLLRFEAELVDVQGVDVQVPRDPNDNPILATLLVSGADTLVSGDEDLLALAGQYPIVSPSGFAERLR